MDFTCKSHSIHDEGQDEEVVVTADVDDLVALEEEGHGGHDANGDGEPYEQLGGAQGLQVDVKESLEVVPKGPKSGHDHKQGYEFLLVDEVAHAPPLGGVIRVIKKKCIQMGRIQQKLMPNNVM